MTESPLGAAAFFAIDDRTAYWRIATRAGVFAVDFDTGAERQLAGADAGLAGVTTLLQLWTPKKDQDPRWPGSTTSTGLR